MPKVATIMKKKDKEPMVRYDSKADAIYILNDRSMLLLDTPGILLKSVLSLSV